VQIYGIFGALLKRLSSPKESILRSESENLKLANEQNCSLLM
jgi:hypothetical protein